MTHIDGKKNQYNSVLYFCSAAGYKSRTMLSKKGKLLTKQPQQPSTLKCVCSRPMQRHNFVWLTRTLKHECVCGWVCMLVCACTCYLPIGALSTLMGGFLAVRQ